MKKIPLIIGLGQKATQYRSLSKYLRICQPDWNTCAFSKMRIGKPDVLCGFSLGCYIAIEHTVKHPVDTLVLCSPTPLDSLDRVKAKKIIIIVGEKETWVRQEACRMAKTVKEISCEIHVVPDTQHQINRKYQEVLLKILKPEE